MIGRKRDKSPWLRSEFKPECFGRSRALLGYKVWVDRGIRRVRCRPSLTKVAENGNGPLLGITNGVAQLSAGSGTLTVTAA